LLLPESAKVSLTLPCDRPFLLNLSLKGQVQKWGSTHRKKGKKHRKRGGDPGRGGANERQPSDRIGLVDWAWGTVNADPSTPTFRAGSGLAIDWPSDTYWGPEDPSWTSGGSGVDWTPDTTPPDQLPDLADWGEPTSATRSPATPCRHTTLGGTACSPPQVVRSKESSTAVAKSAAPPLSTVFCADDADVVIRAAGTLDFRAHKCILSLVSPIIRDMFTPPRPPTKTPGILPHVDVGESAETWEIILRTIYPMPTPVVDSLNDLESLLLAARKYEMQFVIDAHKTSFRNREFILRDPLHLYAIACACGFEDQAEYVARNAELLTITKRSGAGDLKGLTVGSYHNLVSFLAERDAKWHQALGNTRFAQDPCCCDMQRDLYRAIKENLGRPYLQTEEVYLKALEDRSRCDQQAHHKTHNCSAVDSDIKAFVQRMVNVRETLYDNLMGKRKYVQLHPTTINPKRPSSIFFLQVHYGVLKSQLGQSS